ncbi:MULTISPECIES: hypothetical protein [Serratia]|uniref:Uncharacterized protein n=1 Tax=Serratia marcescens TaxID=615 RepID=A0AA46KA19_SERMA|nr:MULTISPECIES: hypothetical protein [Serratia]MBH3188972.1 hypothetical protein [Serratia marcescens]MBH3291571.1 hypothetical protein [Serratia marcescens]MBN5377378.1 hypothetical protein [Serratia marcescens]MBO1808707.1 hypothetical protein [Serratia ureilytica]NMQ37273.1 hypothetical protein [Serratia marcescens]
MSYLKSWGSKLGKGLSHVVEAIFSGVFSVAAFGSLFWFDEWWQRILSAAIFLLLVFATIALCGLARGER